ncbi:MAG: hypothetical protein P0S96_05500 [Simkaniaceae bacterium]|nr:hypothetical protein [Candidatus Sacchlamyda saccharinae]
MAAAVANRPMPVSFDDFNKILNQKVAFFDKDGKKIQCCFWAAIRSAQDSAQGLQDRVLAKTRECGSEVVPGSLLADWQAYQAQFEQLQKIVKLAREVLADFGSMKLTTRNLSDTAKPIMDEADIQEVVRKITEAADYTETNYLTGGTAYCYLPDHLKVLARNVAEIFVGSGDGDACLDGSDAN